MSASEDHQMAIEWETTDLSTVELAVLVEPWWAATNSPAVRKLSRLGLLERCGGDWFRTELGREELKRRGL